MKMASKYRTDLTVAQKRDICAYKETSQDANRGHFSHKWDLTIARTVENILESKFEWISVECHQLKANRAGKPKFAQLKRSARKEVFDNASKESHYH